MPSLKNHTLRLWPNGEFGIGVVQRFQPRPLEKEEPGDEIYRTSWTLSELGTLRNAVEVYGGVTPALERMVPGYWPSVLQEVLQGEVHGAVDSGGIVGGAEGERSDLGSSNASKNHNHRPRGSRGLTSYGRRMLRNGCWLLERAVGKRKVGMVTTTIPTCSRRTQRLIVASWSKITRTFTQWMYRRLKAADAKVPWVLGCTEIQEKRREREGGLPLHLHLVFASRRGSRFHIGKSDFAAAWQRAVCSSVPCAKNLDWNASTRVETVKKSVANYLSKYMTKGSPLALATAQAEGFEMPRSWWFGVGEVKRHIKKGTLYTCDWRADVVWGLSHSNPEQFVYIHKVLIEREGREFVIGIAGKMTWEMTRWIRTAS